MKTKDIIGIALDLNLESVDGIRIDDVIKRSLSKFYNELKQDFMFYLHNPESDLYDLESNEIKENYFSAELNDFSLPCPFKFQTVLNDLLSRVTNGCDIPVLVIEKQKYYYELMLRDNCNVILVGVGDNYDKDSFSSLSNFSSLCDFVHLELNELEELSNVLLFSLKGGEDQIALEIAAKVISNQKNMDNSGHLGFDPSGGFNVSGDVEANIEVEDDLCKQDKSHFEVAVCDSGYPLRTRPLKAKGCAEVKVVTKEKDVVAKKSVKSMKKPTKKSTKKIAKKVTKKSSKKKSEEDK